MRWPRHSRLLAALLALCAVAACTDTALAVAPDLANPDNQWLPSSDNASWIYSWYDSQYAQTPTKEAYTVQSRAGSSFRLAWTTDGLDNGDGAQHSSRTIDYKRENGGLINPHLL